MNAQDAITQAFNLNHRLQHLLGSHEEENVVKKHGRRQVLSMLYWAIIVEHHQGILHLIESDYHASAFALLRSFEEAFLRSFVAVYGTDNELAALWDDKYNAEFEVVGKQMDKELEYGPFLKDHIKMLHSFTHGGRIQWIKFISVDSNHIGTVASKFLNDEALALVMITTLVLFLAALIMADFWGYTSEHQTVQAMHDEYVEEARDAFGLMLTPRTLRNSD